MASRSRSEPDDLTLHDLFRERADQFQIFQALRILEAQAPDAPRLGEARSPRDEPLRIGQAPDMAFPTSGIESYAPGAPGRPARLINRIFGLFGPHGPLPLHLTKYARNRLRNQRDGTLVAFADMLTHRFVTLIYRAWREGQPAASFDRAQDALSDKVAALAGYNARGLRGRDAMPDNAKLHFAAHLALGQRTPEGLLAMVGQFFDAPIEIEEFVGTWLDLEPDDRWSLGRAAGLGGLGQATSLGSHVWSRSAKFRLVIGPVPMADYTRLLPGGDGFARLQAIIRNYVGDTLDCDVRLVLRGADMPRLGLDGAGRLGQTTWLRSLRDDDAPPADAGDLLLYPARAA